MAARYDRRARWPILLIGLVVLALLVAAVVIAGLLPRRVSQATPSPMATPSGTDLASEPSLEIADEPTDDAAWWRMRFDLMAMGEVQVIDVGTLGAGDVATIEVAVQVVGPDVLVFPMRSVIGPSAGLVVTIGADGPESVLTSIDAASGEASEIVRTSHLVIDAGFVGGTSIVFLTADRRTGQLTGSWLVDAAAPGPPEPLEGLLARVPDIQLVARAVSQTRLLVSPTGEVVAVVHCGPAGACGLRAVNLADGTRYEQQIAAGDEPIGLAGELVFIRPTCMEMACPGELLDLATGERMPLPGAGDRLFFDETIIATEGGPVLVTQQTGSTMPMEGAADAPTFALTELDGGRTQPPVEVDLGSMQIAPERGHELGVELPPGWFAVMGAPPIAPGERADVPLTIFAIEATTGRVVPLPALGEFFIQG